MPVFTLSLHQPRVEIVTLLVSKSLGLPAELCRRRRLRRAGIDYGNDQISVHFMREFGGISDDELRGATSRAE